MRTSTMFFTAAAAIGAYAGWLTYLHAQSLGWPWHDSLGNASAAGALASLIPVLVGCVIRSDGG